MSRQETIAEINGLLERADVLADQQIPTETALRTAYSARKRWDTRIEAVITKAFGADSEPLREFRKATAPVPFPIVVYRDGGTSAPSFDENRRLFWASIQTRVEELEAIRGIIDLYDEPLPPQRLERGHTTMSHAARLGLTDVMVDIMERLAMFPAGVDSVRDAGFSLDDEETDRCFQVLEDRRLVQAQAHQKNGSGRTAMIHRVSLTGEGWRMLDEVRNGPKPTAPLIHSETHVHGDNYGSAASQAAGANAAQNIAVDASTHNDLASFVDAVRVMLDELNDDDRVVIGSQLDVIDAELSNESPKWAVISAAVRAITRIAAAIDPNAWPAVIHGGQAALNALHGG